MSLSEKKKKTQAWNSEHLISQMHKTQPRQGVFHTIYLTFRSAATSSFRDFLSQLQGVVYVS